MTSISGYLKHSGGLFYWDLVMGGKSSTISTSEQRILSLQVQQSSQGLTLPVV